MIYRKIQAEWEFLSKTERKIGEIILKSPEEFIGLSAIELSQRAEVSQGSINNFSKKFVNSGFSELKKQLAMELNQYKEDTFDVVPKDGNIKSIMQASVKNISKAFQLTEQMNSEETLQRVAEQIMKAKKIEIYGIFQSGIVANDCYYQLLQLGLPVNYVTDVLMCPVSAMMLDSDSLVIAISSSGRTKDIYEAVKIAKENNVPCICITRNPKGPIAGLCDEVLAISIGDEALSRTAGTVRMCEYYLIDAICSYIRHQMDSNGREQYFKLSEILNSHSMEE